MSGEPKPTWEPFPLRCGPCGHEWDDWLPNGARFYVAIAAMTELRCPQCGAKKLFIRVKPASDDIDRIG